MESRSQSSSLLERLCSNCVSGALAEFGVYCMTYAEPITNERVAEDCEAFRRQGNGSSYLSTPVLGLMSVPRVADELAEIGALAMEVAAECLGDAGPSVGETDNASSYLAAEDLEVLRIESNFQFWHDNEHPSRSATHMACPICAPDLVAICADYLGSLHISSWGKSWSVTSEADRMACAQWLAETIRTIQER